MKKYKKSNSNSMFATLSLFSIGAYYVSNPELFDPNFATEPNAKAFKENPQEEFNKKPKSLIDSATSSFFGSSHEVTFEQWAKTYQAIEAYEKWRKSPEGVKSLINFYFETNDFKLALEKWASSTKRSIKEFEKEAKKSQKYKNDYSTWKSSSEGLSALEKHFIASPEFTIAFNKWKLDEDPLWTKESWLKTPEAQELYKKWLKDQNNLALLEKEWKKSDDYSNQRNQWINLKNQKLNKNAWLASANGRTYFQNWLSSSNSHPTLLANWKTTANYSTKLQNWISVYSQKKDINSYKADKSIWENKFLKYKASPAGVLEIDTNLKSKKEYTDEKASWSQQGKKEWIKSADSTSYYDAWRVTSDGRNAIKNSWEATANYQSKRDAWIVSNYTNKRNKETWLSMDDSTNYYNNWKKTRSAKISLQNKWKTTNDYTTNKDSWIATNYTKRDKDAWSNLADASNKYNTWKATNAANSALKNNWYTTNDYQTKFNQWVNSNLVKRTKDTWLGLAASTSFYNTWRVTSAGRNAIKGTWEATNNYASKKDAWIAANYNKRDKNIWANLADATSKYNTWKATTAAGNALKTHWKTTNDYTSSKDSWIAANYTKRDKDAWSNLADASNKYNTWKATNAANSSLKNNWYTTNDYQTKFNQWVNSNLVKRTKDTWLGLAASTSFYNAWRVTSSGRNAIKGTWEATNNYASKKDAWIAANYTKRDKDTWGNLVDATSKYNTWKATSAAGNALKTHWKTTNDYTSSKDVWIAANYTKRDKNYWSSLSDASSKYNTWKATNAANSSLKNNWYTTNDYQTKFNQWVNSNLVKRTKDTWLGLAASTSFYNAWRVTSAGRNAIKGTWEATNNYASKKDAWIAANYTKRDKDTWGNLVDATSKYNTWKATSAAGNALKTHWKTTNDYTSSKDSWIAANYTKRDKDTWADLADATSKYNTWKATNAATSALKNNWYTTNDYQTKFNQWVNSNLVKRTKDTWLGLAASTSFYNTWRVTSAGRNAIKGTWEATNNYASKKDAWIAANYNKRDKNIWANLADATSKYNTWKATSAAGNALKTHWKTTNDYTTSKDAWIAANYTKRDKNYWSSLSDASSKYNNWKATNAANSALKNNWYTTNYYQTKFNQWVNSNLVKRTKDTWLGLAASTSFYNTWRVTSAGRNAIKGTWEATNNYASKKDAWIAANYNKRDKNTWANLADATSKYYTWKATSAAGNALKTHWKTTNDYTSSKDSWIAANYTKRDKDTWADLADATSKYNTWKATNAATSALKNNWYATNDYQTKFNQWVNSNLVKRTKDTWLGLAASTSFYNAWRVTNSGRNAIKGTWEATNNYASKKDAWIAANYNKRDKDAWANLADATSKYNTWKATSAAGSALKTHWKTTNDYTTSKDAWIAANYMKRNKNYWSSLSDATNKYDTWKVTNAADGALKNNWYATNDYQTKFNQWVNNNLIKRGKDTWLGLSASTSFYNTWRVTDAGRNAIKGTWEATNNYASKRDAWITSNFQKRSKDLWFETSFAKSSYNSWIAKVSSENALKTSWKSTNDYRTARNKWISTSYTNKRGKNYWASQVDATNKYNIWKQSNAGINDLKQDWYLSQHYLGKLNAWIAANPIKRTKDTWLGIADSTNYYNSWRVTTLGRGAIKGAWEATQNFSSERDNWITNNFTPQNSKNSWSLTNDAKDKYDSWKSQGSNLSDLKTHWHTQADFQTKKASWKSKHWVPLTGVDYQGTNDFLTRAKSYALNWSNNRWALYDYYETTTDYVKNKKVWLDNNLVKRSKNIWLGLSDSTRYYDAWRTSNSGRNDIKDIWEATSDYTSSLNSYINTTFKPTNPKSSWQTSSDGDFDSNYTSYKDTQSGETYLKDEYKKTSDYQTSKSSWMTTFMDTHSSKRQSLIETWIKTADGQQSYNNHKDASGDYYNKLFDQWTFFEADFQTKKSQWEQSNPGGDYYFSSQFNVDLYSWRDTSIGNGMTNGMKIYIKYHSSLGRNQITPDALANWQNYFQSNNGEAYYISDGDFENDFATYRDTVSSNGKTNGANLYLNGNESDSSYNNWISTYGTTSFKADSQYNNDLDSWTSVKSNAINIYKANRQSSTDWNSWTDPNPTRRPDNDYRYNVQAQLDAEAMMDPTTPDNDYMKHVKAFFATSAEYKRELKKFINKDVDIWYKASQNYNNDFNAFVDKDNANGGIKFYLTKQQSNTDYNNWITVEGEKTFKLDAQYNTSLDAWSSSKSNGIDLYKTHPQSNVDYSAWTDPNPINPTADDYKQSVGVFSDFMEYRDAIAGNGKTNGFNFYLTSAQSTKDYNSWIDPLGESSYQASANFQSDYIKYRDAKGNNGKTNGYSFYYANNASNVDYNNWTDPNGEASYKANSQYNVDLDAWSRTKANAIDFYKASGQSNTDYNGWSDPNPIRKTANDYKASQTHNNDFITYRDANARNGKSNGFNFYLTQGQSNTDYNNWTDPRGEVNYQSSNAFGRDLSSYRDTNASNGKSNGFNFYLTQGQSNTDYNSWTDPNGEATYKVSNQYNVDLDAWSRTKANAIGLYKVSAQSNTDYNGWSDPNPIRKTASNYKSSQAHDNDFATYRDANASNGKSNGFNFYLTQGQSTTDYNSWTDPQGEVNYQSSNAFNNDFITYRDANASNGKSNGFNFYLTQGQATTDYNSWTDPYGERNYKASNQYNVDLDAWSRTKANAIGLYKVSAQSNTDYNGWSDPNPIRKTASNYKSSQAHDNDFATYRDANASNGKSNGFNFYLTQGQSTTDYNSWTDPQGEVNYQSSNAFNNDFITYRDANASNGKSNGFNFYLTQGQATTDYNSWTDPYGERNYKASNQYNVDLDAWSRTKANAIGLYKASAQSNTDYNGWSDPNPIRKTASNYKSSQAHDNDFATYRDANASNGKSNGFNFYLTQGKSTTDYNSWTDPQGEINYQSSNAFNNDFITYRDANASNGKSNGFNFYLTQGQSNTDYNSWTDPYGERNYKASNQYNVDLDAWSRTKANAIGLYKVSAQSNTDYNGWSDPNPIRKTASNYKSSQAHDNDFATYRDANASNGKSNGFNFYLTQGQSTTDYNSWTDPQGEVNYQSSNAFNNDFITYRDANASNGKSNGFNFYLTQGKSTTDYNSWTDPYGERNYKASNQYNVDLDAWSRTKANAIGLYKASAQSNTDYNGWSDPNPIRKTASNYKSSQAHDNDFATYRDANASNGKSNGFNFYLTQGQSTTDYNSWTDPQGEVNYQSSNAFNNDFITYRDANASNGKSNGFNFYLTQGKSTTDYNSWTDPYGERNYKVSRKYNVDLDAWSRTKVNAIGLYKASAQSNTDYNGWSDPNPIRKTASNYKSSQAHDNDFATYRDANASNGKSNGFNFYLTQGQSTTDYNSWTDPQGEVNYQSSNDFDSDFNSWETKDRGIDLYKASAQSTSDHNKWIDPAGENDYKTNNQYNDDLDAWSSIKANAISFYESNTESQKDWDSLLDTEFLKTNKSSTLLAKLKAMYSEEIYKKSNQFVSDYNSWKDPQVRTEEKYLNPLVYQKDLDIYYDTPDKKVDVYATTQKSDSDYQLYQNDLKDEADYLISNEKSADLQSWANVFENGKSIFADSKTLIDKIKELNSPLLRTKEKFLKTDDFKTALKVFVNNSDLKYFHEYFQGENLERIYGAWKDPIGVPRDPDVFATTKEFVAKLNSWSSSMINGMPAFRSSALAQNLYNKYKDDMKR